MAVVCPVCKRKLGISRAIIILKTKIFKCPSCCRILVIKNLLALQKEGIHQDKILVAHSDAAVIDKITALLSKNGYQAVTSSDGIAAIVKAIKESPSLIVIEGNLPKTNGFEVCRRVMTKTKMKRAKFIFVVSTPEEINEEASFFCDAYRYVEDSQMPELLMEKINEMRDKSKEGKMNCQKVS